LGEVVHGKKKYSFLKKRTKKLLLICVRGPLRIGVCLRRRKSSFAAFLAKK
jgi:hypothetical protein